MSKYVIAPDTALRLARDETTIPRQHQLLAPTLTQPQADAFITVKRLVTVAPLGALA
jgi:hypothetical protein